MRNYSDKFSLVMYPKSRKFFIFIYYDLDDDMKFSIEMIRIQNLNIEIESSWFEGDNLELAANSNYPDYTCFYKFEILEHENLFIISQKKEDDGHYESFLSNAINF